jgi:hypothetical protein
LKAPIGAEIIDTTTLTQGDVIDLIIARAEHFVEEAGRRA